MSRLFAVLVLAAVVAVASAQYVYNTAGLYSGLGYNYGYAAAVPSYGYTAGYTGLGYTYGYPAYGYGYYKK